MLTRIKLSIFRRFRRSEKGLAAVEFALILPVMITMLFGMGELSMAVFARTDITQIASTVADLVAQESAPSSTDLQNVYRAAYTILYPFKNKPTIRITSINYDSTAADPGWTGKVSWTCTSPGGTGSLTGTTPKANNAYSITKPTGATQAMLSTGGSVLMVEVAYTYASPTSQVVLGSYNYTDKFYTKPRRVGQLPPPGTCPTST
jgi:Flp pilus assembly protein TadG